MADPQGQAFEDLRNTLGECTRIVRQRWRLALVALCVVGAGAFWYSQYLPRTYSATTIFERRDDVVLQNLIQGNSPYGFDHLKATMALDMTGSRALLGGLVAVGLLPAETASGSGPLSDAERAALDAAVARYQLQPSVRLIHSTASLDTIQLRCDANDPGVARRLVVALRDRYIVETRERIREILGSTKAFFETEVARLQAQVAAAGGKLQDGFEEFPGLDPTDLVSVGSRLEAVRGQYNVAYQRRAELEAEISAREEFLRAVPPPPADPAASAAAGGPLAAGIDPALDLAIRQVQAEIVELVTARRMTMEHPAVRTLRGRLEALEELRAAALALAPGGESAPGSEGPFAASQPAAGAAFHEWQAQRMRIELELDSLRRQHAIAAAQFADVEARLQRFAGLYERLLARGEELRQLRERRSESENELAIWQQHLARLDRILTAESGARGTQFTLIEEPKDVSRPIKPRVSSIFVACAGLGLAAAALLVALAELLDRSFRSAGQVTRALGVPVLESVGVIPTPRERRRALRARLVWTPALLLLLLALAGSATLAYASLELPRLHARAMQRVDRVLGTVGAAWLLPAGERTT